MTIEEAVENKIITLDEYERVISHIEEIDKIINKYGYLTKFMIDKWEGIKE